MDRDAVAKVAQQCNMYELFAAHLIVTYYVGPQ